MSDSLGKPRFFRAKLRTSDARSTAAMASCDIVSVETGVRGSLALSMLFNHSRTTGSQSTPFGPKTLFASYFLSFGCLASAVKS